MHYYFQKDSCCMPTALYQVGAISIEILHAFEKDFAATSLLCTYFQQDWCRKYFSPLIDYFDNNYSIGSNNIISVPLTGKGILIMQVGTDMFSRHAISYENGFVLDSAEIEKLITWKEYTQTFPDRTILKIIPTG